MPPKRQATEDLSSVRLRSRQDYLAKREAIKLAELRKEVEDDYQELANNASLTKAEVRDMERRRQTLRLAQERAQIDDGQTGFFIPDSEFDDKTEVLNKRNNEKDKYRSEVDIWEESQTSKAKAAQTQRTAHTADDYEYVFEPTSAVKFDIDVKDWKSPEQRRLEEQLNQAEEKAKSIDAVRRSLPVFKYKEELLAAIEKYNVVIVQSATGSGKTTQIPQYLLEALESKGDKTKLVGCTQPRRVAAMSVARRVAEEDHTQLGKRVGYRVRFDDKTSEATRILYMTDGMLLREILSSPLLEDYAYLIIDEAHERTVSTDLILALMRDLVLARPEFRLIISSATLDSQKFSTYYHSAPIFNIPGRSFPVTCSFTQNPEANYLSASITTVFQIHLSQELPGDILVFLTGEEEITSACASIEETSRKLGKAAPELICLPLYAALESSLQSKVFEPTPKGCRKVVVSSNIAETSITIDGVKWVIDCGYSKENHYDSRTGIESLIVAPISRASADQRAGRAGRVSAGTCLRLFSRWSFYNELPISTVPEIQRVALAGPILMLKSLGINDLINFPFLDPPSPQVLSSSLEELYALGALTSEGSLSTVGRRMAEFPLSPKLSKVLIQSDKLKCTSETLTIVAVIGESATLFLRPKDKKLYADAARRRFQHPEGGDFMTMLNVWNAFVESDYDPIWCKENFLEYRALNRARDVRGQLEKLCDRVEVDASLSSGTDHITIRKAITSGYFMNVGRLNRNGQSYRNVKSGLEFHIHPSSGLLETRPKWVLYNELVLTSKEFARGVMEIDPAWLTELAPHYFKQDDIEKLGVDKKMPKGQGKVGVDGR
ncbi:hypothetical protein N0V90_002404 [Kalmusia sp. IMI 367209]|nr:hypothetical protein N0V90_002404 [Kalmusia sp. IMI 367209]